ncbi:MAG: helix-turn-helix domain-containing protein [Acetobacteraceae bacterium]
MMMRNAPTLKAAILDVCANQHRYVRGSVIYLVIQDQIAFWGYAVYIPGMPAIEQACDCATAVGFNMMKELVATPPDDVLTCRDPPCDVVPYRQFFSFTPRFNAEQHALAFPARLLAQPVRGADPELRRVLEKSVAEYWAVRQPSIADRVIRILRARVIFPGMSLEDVAEHLLMHPRTLNRRLQLECTNFRKLLNEARFEVARQLLAGTKMEVTDIGLALGYADPSGFTHAFQRWSGAAPRERRAQL